MVTPSHTLEVATNPDDNILLECADGVRAHYLITGNQRHLPTFWKKTKNHHLPRIHRTNSTASDLLTIPFRKNKADMPTSAQTSWQRITLYLLTAAVLVLCALLLQRFYAAIVEPSYLL